MAKKKETFETVLQDLEAVVARLETGDLPLEEALACFENGVKAAGRCQALLKDAELKIEQLGKGADGTPVLLPLGPTDLSAGD